MSSISSKLVFFMGHVLIVNADVVSSLSLNRKAITISSGRVEEVPITRWKSLLYGVYVSLLSGSTSMNFKYLKILKAP